MRTFVVLAAAPKLPGKAFSSADPRWDAFGFNAPGAVESPDVPEVRTVTPGGAGTLLAGWADARRATRYRVWPFIVGVDSDLRAAATVTNSDATLIGLPGGRTTNVRVSAANDAGESLPCAEIEAVVE